MKKITLLLMLCLAQHHADAQDSCTSPVAITTGGFYSVGPINGAPTSLICTGDSQVAQNAEWYAYTPTQNHTVTISTNIAQNTPRIDTRFHVYTGVCGTFSCYAGDDDSGLNLSSVATFNVTANTTYMIAFDNLWSFSGFTFQLTEGAVVVPTPAPVTFTSKTIPTILHDNNTLYSTCAVDMNKDYRDDIVSVSSTNIRIHYQNANGTFNMVDYPTAMAEHIPYWSIAAGDFNKDGYNDLLYGSGEGLTLMKSNGSGTGYLKNNPGQYIFCQRTNFIDINNDGHLDAFSCHDIAPNCYYINDGSANFSFYQVGTTPGAMNLGNVRGNYATIWTDYDNDGDQDMFISKCSGPPCELHRNDGNGVFTNVAAAAHLNFVVESWSSAVFDYDNDGDMDILVGSNGNTGHKFMKNNLDTSNSVEEPFTDITAGSGWDTDNNNNRDYIAYDFDNDGFVDVMGGGHKILFNKGNGTFSPVTVAFSVGPVADFNNDGFLDVQNGNILYMSAGNSNKWITINLTGIESNSNGIGARVELYGSWGKQIRDIRSGEGFEFMSTLSAHFGIGSASSIDKVVIKWPSGKIDEIRNPSSNQSLTVVEGSSPQLAINQSQSTVFSIYPNPANDMINIRLNNQSMHLSSAEIFDLTGRLVKSPELLNNTIDVKSLAAGSYILVLKDNTGGQSSQKFIKK